MMNNVAQLFPIEETRPEANRFDEFWAACLERKGKAVAQQKYNAIISATGLRTRTLDRDSGTYVDIELKATEEQLISAMKKYAREKMGPDFVRSKFIMHPSTWLNKGMFLDYE